MATNRERSYWRFKATETINKVIEQWFYETKKSPFIGLQPSEKTELLRRIDAAYPFGIRQYHPYKVWLSVRAETKIRFKIAPPLPAKTRKQRAIATQDHPNQLSIFEQE